MSTFEIVLGIILLCAVVVFWCARLIAGKRDNLMLGIKIVSGIVAFACVIIVALL
ncbi:MAG: hypothetical protein FWE38_03725 [Firmicutes bacterium]|nr:hypothetical protein [Bacillota bacterium]